MSRFQDIAIGGKVPPIELKVLDKVSEKVFKMCNSDEEQFDLMFSSAANAQELIVGSSYMFKNLTKKSDNNELLFKYSFLVKSKRESVDASSSSVQRNNLETMSMCELICEPLKFFEKSLVAKVV